jgi:hypothetical protein
MSTNFLKAWMPVKKSSDKKIITVCAVFHVNNNMDIISHVPPVPITGNLFLDFEMIEDESQPKTPMKWIFLQPEATLSQDYDKLPDNHVSAITLVCADGSREDSGSINTGGAPIL